VGYRLPTDVRLALAGSPAGTAPDPPPLGCAFLYASEKERSAASFRGVLIDEWKRSGLRKDDFIAAYNSGDTDRRTFKELGPVSLRTFYRWINNFSQTGMDGIVPRYGAASGGPDESLSDIGKTLLERFWLRTPGPSSATPYGSSRRTVPVRDVPTRSHAMMALYRNQWTRSPNSSGERTALGGGRCGGDCVKTHCLMHI
jgi:hypothetical protein